MYFSKLNGYDVKDKEAREYIEQLRNTKANQTEIEMLTRSDELIVAEQEQLNETVSQLTNPNLLINSDFRNPINQRGSTTYEISNFWKNIYTVDRWILT